LAIVSGYERLPPAELDPWAEGLGEAICRCRALVNRGRSDDIAVIPRAYFVERITKLGPDRLTEVCRALTIATGC
jgi:hypothetical protein